MTRSAQAGSAPRALDAALLETWALSYLARYASSADNLRRVLMRRVRRLLGADRDTLRAADALIEALVARYCDAQLLDDAAYAAARARRDLARGRSLRRIAAGLAAKGVGGADAAAAIGALREGAADPDLVAAVAFARRRRLGPFRAQERDRDRELAAFVRAGFARQTAEAVLACADAAAIDTLLADHEAVRQ
ncbi:MAG TPA: RecX family transcriptional regulator [Stellaceae bacterium]|nr:RecX family transcriptional regulator [Stellaceae bacterium]